MGGASPTWSYCSRFSGLLRTAYALPMAARAGDGWRGKGRGKVRGQTFQVTTSTLSGKTCARRYDHLMMLTTGNSVPLGLSFYPLPSEHLTWVNISKVMNVFTLKQSISYHRLRLSCTSILKDESHKINNSKYPGICIKRCTVGYLAEGYL